MVFSSSISMTTSVTFFVFLISAIFLSIAFDILLIFYPFYYVLFVSSFLRFLTLRVYCVVLPLISDFVGSIVKFSKFLFIYRHLHRFSYSVYLLWRTRPFALSIRQTTYYMILVLYVVVLTRCKFICHIYL